MRQPGSWLGRKIKAARRRLSAPLVGWVRLGSLRRTTPFSREWGFDRGRPVDRYYIEGFIAQHAGDIRGAVLEVGDDRYTREFGGPRVTSADVLNLNGGHPRTTVVADLTDAAQLASNAYDCIIATQTLQLIFDVRAAIETLHRILRPGGVLLTTVPGITHTGDADWSEHWCWSFTAGSARRLFHPVFGEPNTTIARFGNVLSATAFLYGMADRELRARELDVHDPAYDVIIAVRATKA